MEEEAEKLKQMQSEVNKQMTLGSPTGIAPIPLSIEEKKEIDDRSIYVGNVDYGATAEELENHFHGCGSMNRVTILCNKVDGHPKGFAYIEFGSKDFVETALAMNDTLFRGRQIKVNRNPNAVQCIRNDYLVSFAFRLCQNERIDRGYRQLIDFRAAFGDARPVPQLEVVVATARTEAHDDQCKIYITQTDTIYIGELLPPISSSPVY